VGLPPQVRNELRLAPLPKSALFGQPLRDAVHSNADLRRDVAFTASVSNLVSGQAAVSNSNAFSGKRKRQGPKFAKQKGKGPGPSQAQGNPQPGQTAQSQSKSGSYSYSRSNKRSKRGKGRGRGTSDKSNPPPIGHPRSDCSTSDPYVAAGGQLVGTLAKVDRHACVPLDSGVYLIGVSPGVSPVGTTRWAVPL